MKGFATKVNDQKPLILVTKRYVLEVFDGLEYISDILTKVK